MKNMSKIVIIGNNIIARSIALFLQDIHHIDAKDIRLTDFFGNDKITLENDTSIELIASSKYDFSETEYIFITDYAEWLQCKRIKGTEQVIGIFDPNHSEKKIPMIRDVAAEILLEFADNLELTCLSSFINKSVSNFGDTAIQKLLSETKDQFFIANGIPKIFDKSIAGNIHPTTGKCKFNEMTLMEKSITEELDRLTCRTQVLCSRVPVCIGDMIYISAESRHKNILKFIKQKFVESDRFVLCDGDDRYISPKEAKGNNNIYINRLILQEQNHFICCLTYDNIRQTALLCLKQIDFSK